MSNYICFLITILVNNDALAQCALRVCRDDLTGDCALYPMEPENREQLRALLPIHLRDMGPIVAVKEILDVVVADDAQE